MANETSPSFTATHWPAGYAPLASDSASNSSRHLNRDSGDRHWRVRPVSDRRSGGVDSVIRYLALAVRSRTGSSSFGEVIESFVLSRHDLREWTRRSYEKSLRRLECATLADFTEEMLDQHIAAKLNAKRLTTAHHDGVSGAATYLSARACAHGARAPSPQRGSQ